MRVILIKSDKKVKPLKLTGRQQWDPTGSKPRDRTRQRKGTRRTETEVLVDTKNRDTDRTRSEREGSCLNITPND